MHRKRSERLFRKHLIGPNWKLQWGRWETGLLLLTYFHFLFKIL